jgi:hypothetical protein
MSIDEKRYIISKAYPGMGWSERVKKMPDKQVHVVYMRLLDANKLKGIK